MVRCVYETGTWIGERRCYQTLDQWRDRRIRRRQIDQTWREDRQTRWARAFEPQIEALQKGVEIIVGTPGRIYDLYRKGQVKLASVTRVVLDEAV